MHRVFSMRVSGLALMAVVAGSPAARAEGPGPGGAAAAAAAAHALRAECVEAWSGEIRFAEPRTVDQVRVQLRGDDPFGLAPGAARVEVSADGLGRALRVAMGGEWRLRFDPGLRARAFHVSLDPVFTAPSGACVETISLYHQGVVVAVVKP